MQPYDTVCPGPPAAVLLVLALAAAGPPAHAQTAPDTTGFSAPAPLIIPGRTPGDSVQAPAGRAAEHYIRGVTFLNANKRTAALTSFQNCVQSDPTYPDAYFQLGMLFLSGNNVEEARQCFAEELKHHPDHVLAQRELGFTLGRLGRAAEGFDYLKAYTDSHPEDGLGWYGLGFTYMGMGRTADAEKAIRKAIDIGPANGVWHRDLGAVLAARGDTEGARSEYARALQLNPQNPTPLINLGNLEVREGNAQAALKAYRAAEALDSTLSLALHGQVQVLRDLGRDDEVGEVYVRWLRTSPAEHAARLEAVRFFEKQGRPELALQLARDGVRWDAQSGDAHLVMGLALHAAGDTRGALQSMHTADAKFQTPREREQVRRLVGAMKRATPDSLHHLFPPDSALAAP